MWECPKAFRPYRLVLIRLIYFRGYFKGHKGAIWTFVIYLGQYQCTIEMVHDVTNVCMKHIYKVMYYLSVDIMTFDFGLLLKVKSRSKTFHAVVSHKWCII